MNSLAGVTDYIDSLILPSAQFLTSNLSSWITSLAIVLVAIVSYVRFHRSIARVNRDLRSGKEALNRLSGPEQFVERFADVEKTMGEIEALCTSWYDYRQTLLSPEHPQRRIIRSPHEASTFFTENACINSQFNLALYRAVPSFLTGFGILGTFIGLVAGIYLANRGLTSDNPEIVNKALAQLLGGAALAFMTSIAGLATSIPFSWILHRKLHQAQVVLAEFNLLHRDLHPGQFRRSRAIPGRFRHV